MIQIETNSDDQDDIDKAQAHYHRVREPKTANFELCCIHCHNSRFCKSIPETEEILYAGYCIRVEPSNALVMTKKEFSEHLKQVVLSHDTDGKEGVYCNCIFYDNAHRIVETELEKRLWNRVLRQRHQRGNFYEELPGNAKLVARPARWGSKFKVGTDKEIEKTKESMEYYSDDYTGPYTLEDSLMLYHNWLHEQLAEDPKFIDPLKPYVSDGKMVWWKLTCYCPVDITCKCHADILNMHINGECKL